MQQCSCVAYQLGLAPARHRGKGACPLTLCIYVMQFELKLSIKEWNRADYQTRWDDLKTIICGGVTIRICFMAIFLISI